jgi:transposase
VTIRLYFDEDAMWHALVTALRARGIDVQTALEAAMIERAGTYPTNEVSVL